MATIPKDQPASPAKRTDKPKAKPAAKAKPAPTAATTPKPAPDAAEKADAGNEAGAADQATEAKHPASKVEKITNPELKPGPGSHMSREITPAEQDLPPGTSALQAEALASE